MLHNLTMEESVLFIAEVNDKAIQTFSLGIINYTPKGAEIRATTSIRAINFSFIYKKQELDRRKQ